jgi:hypothetical protein
MIVGQFILGLFGEQIFDLPFLLVASHWQNSIEQAILGIDSQPFLANEVILLFGLQIVYDYMF